MGTEGKPEPRFGYSLNEEEYHGRYASREEALAAALDDEPEVGKKVWTGRCVKPGEYADKNAEEFGRRIVEVLEEEILEEFSGCEDAIVEGVDHEALGKHVVTWLLARGNFAPYYTVEDVEEHPVPEPKEEEV